MVLFWLEHQLLDSSNHRSRLFASFSDVTHPNERTRLPAASVWAHIIYWAISHKAQALSGIWLYMYKMIELFSPHLRKTHTYDP